MQLTGTLQSWHDDKGFGFIAPTQGGRELFVHISAFPRDGTRPTIGETLLYELGQGRDGKPQAVEVVRKAVGIRKAPAKRAASAPVRQQAHSRVGQVIALVLLIGLGVFAFKQYQSHTHRIELEAASTEPSPAPLPVSGRGESPAGFRCDGRRTCSQMTSCQEATWFINHCPGTEMDGNHDGTPCVKQWCTSPLAR